jgi:23S rRNA pseudouridine1911/1915/1917 synthase
MTAETQPIEKLVPEEQAGERLDRFLAATVPDLSRSRLQALIRAGAVMSGERTISDPGQRVKPGETYRITVPPPAPAEPVGENIPLDIVYEDEHLIVLNKPAGLVVHPAAGHAEGTLVNALIAHCGDSLAGIGGVRRPGIVHRLDKDTSGLIVVAKTDQAHKSLSDQFRSHGEDGRLERQYLALVWGVPLRPRDTISAPLARSNANRTKIAVSHSEHARHAVTHYEVIETFRDEDGKAVASLLQLRLETGRTHQIRVHLAHVGHPVMGDPTYGAGFRSSVSRLRERAQSALARLDRQALHAAQLGVEHPATGEQLVHSSPLPADIAELVEALRGPANAGPGKQKLSRRTTDSHKQRR